MVIDSLVVHLIRIVWLPFFVSHVTPQIACGATFVALSIVVALESNPKEREKERKLTGGRMSLT